MRYIVFILVLSLISSCTVNSSTCTIVPLTKEELSWFKGYKDGEMRLYKSQFGAIDTFKITTVSKQSYSPCNRIETSEYQYGSIVVSYKPQKCRGLSSFYCNFSIRFTKEFQESTAIDCNKDIKFYDLKAETFNDFNKIPIKTDTLLLNQTRVQAYKFVLGENVEDANSGSTPFTSFYINKKYGLTCYKTEKGEIYKYWKKI